MSAQGQKSIFAKFMSAAEGGRLSIATIFEAMRAGDISEDEAKELLRYIQCKVTPLWQRILAG